MILTKTNINSFNIEEAISQKIDSDKINELLLIVPTNRKRRYLRREIVNSTQKKAIGKLNLQTIGSFSEKLFESNLKSPTRLLSEACSIALLDQCFRLTKLNYFSAYDKQVPFGTLQRIKNIISEYKRHGITPDKLRVEAEQLTGSEKLKALDISHVYELYNSKCSHINAKEIGDIYQDLILSGNTAIQSYFKLVYSEVNLVVINGFDEFTEPEIDIINVIASLNGINLFVSFDYYLNNPNIFSHLNKCYRRLIGKGFKEITDDSAGQNNNFQKIIREKLFNGSDAGKTVDYSDSITVISAPTRVEEVKAIAKTIKEIISAENTEPHKICIAFNIIHDYSPLIRYYFPLYGLQFNLTDRLSLSSSAPVISIINYLEIIENDFYYKNIFRALSGNVITGFKIDYFGLIKACTKLKITSGIENWRNALKDGINISASNEDEIFPYNSDKNIFQKALNDINQLYEWLSPFSNIMTTAEFLSNLRGFVLSKGFISNLINDTEENIEPNLKAVSLFFEEIGELFELIDLQYEEKKKYPLKFFLQNIRTVIKSARFNVKEKPDNGVQITTLNEIRGLKFDYLFIAGMVDGDFPTRYSPEIFFSGSFIKKEMDHQIEERYHFYQSLCSWNKKLYFTFPQRNDRTELIESNYLNDFKIVFDISAVNENNLSEKIYSKDDLLIYVGKNISDGFKEQLNIDILDINNIMNFININNIRVEKPFDNSVYTGYIRNELSENPLKILDEYKNKVYSTTQLETYALCPFKYFLERVLKVETAKEPTEEIESLELGSLLHEILFEFSAELKDKNISLSSSNEEQFKIAYDLIFKIAEEKVDKANFKSPLSFFEKEKILGINGNKNNSILFKFLQNEKSDDNNFNPQYFESSFGDQKKVNNYIPFELNGIKLSGKIDRIDINDEEQKYRVIDYKLGGKQPANDDLLSGLSIQLPLYLIAGKTIIHEKLKREFLPAEAAIFSLKPANKDFGKKNVINESNSEELINLCTESIVNYVSKIIQGEFNLSKLIDREKKVCRFCDFKSICRIQQAR